MSPLSHGTIPSMEFFFSCVWTWHLSAEIHFGWLFLQLTVAEELEHWGRRMEIRKAGVN